MGSPTLVAPGGSVWEWPLTKAPPQLRLVDPQLQRLDAVDRDHGDPLEVHPKQAFVAIDVALGEGERPLGAPPHQQRAGLVTQAAALAAVQDDVAGQAARPPAVEARARSPVAYTSSPR